LSFNFKLWIKVLGFIFWIKILILNIGLRFGNGFGFGLTFSFRLWIRVLILWFGLDLPFSFKVCVWV
jgi:hypothetical protein